MPIIEGAGGTALTNAGAPVNGTDEQQTITVGGGASGQYAVRFEGFTTGLLAVTATAAQVQTALRALAPIGSGGCSVAGGAGGPYTVTFSGDLGKRNVSLLEVETQPTGATVAIAVAVAGVTATLIGAPTGAMCIDSTNGAQYQNTGTPAAPVWVEVLKADQASETEIGYLSGVTPGTAAASKVAVLGANKNLDEFHTAALYLGAGAGTQVARTAAEINLLMKGTAAGKSVIGATVALCGANPTQLLFSGADVAATLLGTADGPFTIAPAQTFVVNPDAAGDQTATFAGTQGTSTSAAAPSTDISGGTDNKFNVSVDGDAPGEVALTIGAGLNSGANIAAEMQSKIQALGGNKAAVTVAFAGGLYVITSGTYGTGSSVVITDAASDNVADDLKIGVANGGTEAAGTGDAVNLAATTAAEVVTKLAALAGLTATAVGNKVRITSDTAGSASSLQVNAACALDTVFGITGSNWGKASLGLSGDMANDTYQVLASTAGLSGAPSAGSQVGVGGKATTGFNLYCETAASVQSVDLLILGAMA